MIEPAQQVHAVARAVLLHHMRLGTLPAIRRLLARTSSRCWKTS